MIDYLYIDNETHDFGYGETGATLVIEYKANEITEYTTVHGPGGSLMERPYTTYQIEIVSVTALQIDNDGGETGVEAELEVDTTWMIDEVLNNLI